MGAENNRLANRLKGLVWGTFTPPRTVGDPAAPDIPFTRLWRAVVRLADSALSGLAKALHGLWIRLRGTPKVLVSTGRKTLSAIPRRVSLTAMILMSLALALEVTGAVLARSQKVRVSVAELDRARAPRDLSKASAALRRKLSNMAPAGMFVVIDTASNRMTIMQGTKMLREAVVSCGSGSVLDDPYGDRRWVFDTPRGEFNVKTKIKDPYWVKPDWAFIEEGEVIPRDDRDRIESGVMGEYALGIGGGYFLHGTLYTRLLGRNVTHGCVRIGDEDLEYLYRVSPMGTKVYIF